MTTVPVYTASQIKHMTELEDFRVNSAQYVKGGGIDTDCQLLLEILLNASDEAIDPNRIYTIKLVLFTDGKHYQAAVQDHGRGIPIEVLVDVYTKRATSGKYDSAAYNGLSSGCWGVGSKLTNALSDHFISISKRPDGFGGVRFAKGVEESYITRERLDDDETTNGTTVIYQTDPTILKETDFYMTDPRGLETTLKTLEFMGVFKSNLDFQVYRVDKLLPAKWFEKSFEEQWTYINGIHENLIYQSPQGMSMSDYAKKECRITSPTVWQQKLVKRLNLQDEEDKLGYTIELGIVRNPEKESGLIGIVNGNIISVAKASHIAGLQTAVKEKLMTYIDEDNTELRSFFEHQYFIPFHGYVNVQYKGAKFISQTKSSFENVDFMRIYRARLLEELGTWPAAAFEQLFDLIQADMIKRFAQNNNKTLNTGKSLKNVSLELNRPDSYYACETKDKNLAVLHIVEGESAGTSVVQLRYPSFQAVYELRGKCLNTFTSRKELWLKDDVYTDLVRLIGVHPNDTNLDNMNFKEIVLMADADPDGLSIIDLLIGMIWNINPKIIEEGRVVVAMPPLYVISSGDKMSFIRDQRAMDDARVVIYENHLDIEVLVNGSDKPCRLEKSTYRDVVYLVKRVCDIIESVSRKLAVEPFIVEQLCHCVPYMSPSHVATESVKQILNLDSCVFNESSKVLTLIQGRREYSVPIDRLVNEINNYIMPQLRAIKWEDFTLLITTKDTDYYKHTPVSFWQLKQRFDIFDKEFEIRRIKGLAECLPDDLRFTCLNPNTRTVVRIRGVGDAEVLYNMLGVDTAARKKLLMTDMSNVWQRGGF